MPLLRDAQIIEHFHLALLQVLQARLDQASYIVKGGANLRYFFDSVRYSEDIDFDVRRIEAWALADKVDEILASPAIRTVLRSGGLEVKEVTKPKQTETTQRWKVALAVAGRSSQSAPRSSSATGTATTATCSRPCQAGLSRHTHCAPRRSCTTRRKRL